MMTVAQVQRRVRLRRAAVLGAGVMGRTIAAHLASTGIPTVMLDLGDLAHKAHQSLRQIDPAALFLPDLDRLIEPGSLENDLARAAEADWIIEAIIEDLPTKQALLARLLPFWRPGTVVTTNTSGLPVGRIAEETPAEFRRFFLGAHFFNPPRYMKLLEIIPTPDTDPAITAAVAAWGDRLLGKGIGHCKDTPNFIANRLGTYGFLRTVQLMLEFGLSVEEVDELTGPLLGRPRTATFRLLDLAGLDVALAVAEHAYQNLPHDESRETFRPPAPLQEMVRRGWIGEKKGGGFYRRVDGEIQALDLSTMDYRPRRKASFPWVETTMTLEGPDARLRAVTSAKDKGGQFLWTLVRDVLVYAARRIPEISDDIVNVDRAIRWGFAWEHGPFETWDALGVKEMAARLEREGVALPPVVTQVLQQGSGAFYRREDARLLYFDCTTAAYRPVPDRSGVIVLADQKRAGKAVVAAPAGRTLAGGAEICLAAVRVQAAAETYMGLVETGVGLIPAGGGTMEMVKRAMGRIPPEVTADALPLLRWVFETVALAKVSRSALEAQRLGFLREADGISVNTDRLIQDAKAAALAMGRLGQRGRAALESLLYILKTGGHITAYDEVVGRKLAHIMAGGDVPEGTGVSEDYLLDLEREAFLSLLGEQKTQERMRHLLQTGKPLRN